MKVQTNTHQNNNNVSHLKYCLSLSDLLRLFPPHSKRFFFAYFLIASSADYGLLL